METAVEGVRFGHALGRSGMEAREAVRRALEVARGKVRLEPRAEAGKGARWAESLLGCSSPRPLYSYIGDLNPRLGTVGLIFNREWAERELSGLSRCDSGGLYGGRGELGHLEADEVARGQWLLALSTPRTCELGRWREAFAAELRERFERGLEGYVQGAEPRVEGWEDPRAEWIRLARAAGRKPDRRLWTWEARMSGPPLAEELCALVLSPQAAKELDPDWWGPSGPPEGVLLLGLQAESAEGWEELLSQVRSLLQGGAP